MPSSELLADGELDVVIAGCVVDDLSPTHQCSACGRQFGGRHDQLPEIGAPTEAELRTAHCWFPTVDRVPGDPATTEFKQRARLHQASWRERQGYPIGTQPIAANDAGAKLVGSRIAWSYALEHGCNMISPGALEATRHRLAHPEPHQTLNPQRLWADLLSSMPMCWNLFGPLAVDPNLANTAVHTWFPETPGDVVAIRLEWSPGRCDPQYLDNRTAFDAAIEVTDGAGGRGVIGIETKYHEHAKPDKVPNPERLDHYHKVSDASGIFEADAVERIVGTDLQQIWLDHLLVLSMLQHPSDRWTWGRYVLVHPQQNPSFARLADRYRELLVDPTTFEACQLESLIAADGPLPQQLSADLRDRYLW